MHQYDIRLCFFQNGFDSFQNIDCYIKQRLLVLHDGKIVIRYNRKRFQHLIQHLPVLAGHAYNLFNVFALLQLIDQWAHLDCFGASTED